MSQSGGCCSQGCVVEGRHFIPMEIGYYSPQSSPLPGHQNVEDIIESLFKTHGSQFSLVQHDDHFDYVVNSKLYHITERCCEKECIPPKSGGFIFNHGDASALRHRRKNQEIQPADLCEILTHETAEHVDGRAETAPDAAALSSKLYVEGMCCSSEAAVIHDLLDGFPGVLQVDVSVITRSAVIKHTDAVSPQTLVACLNHAHLDAYLEPPRRQEGLSYRYLPSWNVLLAAFLLVVSLFHYLAGSTGRSKMEYMKWIALGSIAIALPKIFLKALAALKRKRLDINFLMTVAVGGALALQDVTEAAAVVVLFSLADWLESSCTSSARNAVAAVLALKPDVAVLASTGASIPADLVEVGSILLVRPGEKIAIDGTVLHGSSDVDQSLLTGEARAVRRSAGDQLLGGTVNCGSSTLEYTSTTTAGESAVARMAILVEQAVSKQSKMESIITRFATWFTPIIIAVCLGIALIPIAAGTNDRERWVYLSLQILVTACPCALVLSTPVTVVAGLAASARQGVLIKGGQHLEALAKINTVTFDKTGTLTKGRFQVVWKGPYNRTSEQDLLEVAGSIERLSTHPIASCIVACAVNAGAKVDLNVSSFQNLPGLGVMALVQGRPVLLGSKTLLLQNEVVLDNDIVASLETRWGNEGVSICYVASDGRFIGALALADAPRPEAAEAISRLQCLEIATKMLTGDAQGPAFAVGAALGIDARDTHAALLPEDKLNLIEELQVGNWVLHVGDGINDAPALAAASVGISMGTSGAAIAVEAGDVTLFTNDLRCIAPIIRLGRTVQSIIIFNIIVCIVTKVAVLILAALGLFTLWGAVLVDVGTACAVCLNGMRCLRWNIATGSVWDWKQPRRSTTCMDQAKKDSDGRPACCKANQTAEQGGGACSSKDAAADARVCPQREAQQACCKARQAAEQGGGPCSSADAVAESSAGPPIKACEGRQACCESNKAADEDSAARSCKPTTGLEADSSMGGVQCTRSANSQAPRS